jgi:hypothetical protein
MQLQYIIKYYALAAIFALISHGINAYTYSINLMWINNDRSSDQQYLCANYQEYEYTKKCLDPLADWVKKATPDAQVNVWYDSNFSTPAAIERTHRDLLKEAPDARDRFTFMDIRDLAYVRIYPEVFSNKTNLNFRSDLLRVIVADYLARMDNHDDYIVYSDLNIPALSKQEIFDDETLRKLKLYGLVLAKNKSGDLNHPYENSFFILDSQNESMMQVSKEGLIDINIKRAQEFLNRGYTKQEESLSLGTALCESKFSQILWMSYGAVFQYYLYLAMAAEILRPGEKLKSIIDKNHAYNNIELLHDAAKITIPRDAIRTYLYTNGFAYPELHWTFGEPDLIEHIILRQYIPSDIKSVIDKIDKEKQFRRLIRERNIELFAIHKISFQPTLYYWRQSSHDIYESHASSEDIIFISLEKDSNFAIPTKDVNKSVGHFDGLIPKDVNKSVSHFDAFMPIAVEGGC